SDLRSSDEFYTGLLRLEQLMEHGWIVTLADPSDSTREVRVVSHDAPASALPDVSIDVHEFDAVRAMAKHLGAEIVHPRTDEAWGVRRFFVKDPDGHVLNILGHQ